MKAAGLKKNSNMNVNASQNSNSTNANTHERQSHDEFRGPDSDNEGATEPVLIRKRTFSLETETGQRGAQPESNQILDKEQTLIAQRKDKCLEVFRNCTEIRDAIVSPELNPQGLDLNQIVELLYSSRQFVNLLGDLLGKKPATPKLEKFFAQQVREKLRELSLDRKIEDSFAALSQRIQDRLNRLQNTKFELPDEMEDLNQEKRGP